MICPLCSVGDICLVRINATGELVHVCNECEALWPSGTSIGDCLIADLSKYVFDLGVAEAQQMGGWRFVTMVQEPAEI